MPTAALGQAQVVNPDAALTPRNDRVTLPFDAPVEIRQVTVEVVKRGGETIGKRPTLRNGDPQIVDAEIEPGSEPWLIAWRALSRDGHVTSGLIGGDPRIPGPDRPMARVTANVGRTLAVAALAFIVGLVAFRWGVVGRAWREGGLKPPGRPDGEADGFRERAFPVLEWASNRWWDALWIAVGLLGLGLVGTVVGTLWALDSRDIGGLLLHARLGHASLALTAAGLITVALGFWFSRRTDGDDPLPPVGQALGLGLPAAVALWFVSWSGHAATGTDATLNIALDYVHNLAGAVWLGGLLGMLSLLIPAGLRLEDDDRLRLVSASVVRFSGLGLAAVALLVITGIYRAIAEVGDFDRLVNSAYGWVLVAKVAVFALMCAVAAYNRFVIHPRLERAGLGLEEDDRGASRRLASTAGAELALGIVVLILVGFLIGTAPPA